MLFEEIFCLFEDKFHIVLQVHEEFFVFLLELQMLFLFLQPPLLLKSLLLLQLRSLLPLLQQLLFLILNFFHKANPFFFADGS